MPRPKAKVKQESSERLEELCKELKEDCGISNAKLAALIHVTPQIISGYLHGNNIPRDRAEDIIEQYQLNTGKQARVEWLLCYDDAKTYDDAWDATADAFEKEWNFRESCFLYAIRNLGYTAEESPKPLHPELADMYGQEGCYEYYHIKKDGEVIATLSNYDVSDIEEDIVELLCAIVRRGIKRANEDARRVDMARLYRENTEMLKQGRNHNG